MMKDGYEDYQRYIADYDENNRKYQYFDPYNEREFSSKKCQDIKVGDIVYVILLVLFSKF